MRTKISFILLLAFLTANIQLISCFSLREIFEDIISSFNAQKASYKLIYFNVRARAEFIRFIFAAAGQEYEDYRVKNEDWAAVKPTTPFGQLPVLKVTQGSNVHEIAQSLTIGKTYLIKKIINNESSYTTYLNLAKFLAKRFNLAGRNEIEETMISMYGDQVNDLMARIFQIRNNDTAIENYYKNIFPNELGVFEERLKKTNSGFLIGENLSWADLYLTVF